MSQITEPLRCLQKTEDCNSLKCKRIVECTDPEYSASCYAITQLNDKNKPEVLLADCWGRGDECNSPSLLIKKIENKIANELHHDDSYIDKLKSYDLSEHLKNASIQDKCIGYIDSNDHPYLIKNNRSFCCCTGHVCNANLAYAYERNPYLVFAEKMNPENIHNKANSGIDDNHGLNLFISARDLTMLCISGFICFFIMGVILALFFLLEKEFENSKK